jgi:hypothetical protein
METSMEAIAIVWVKKQKEFVLRLRKCGATRIEKRN